MEGKLKHKIRKKDKINRESQDKALKHRLSKGLSGFFSIIICPVLRDVILCKNKFTKFLPTSMEMFKNVDFIVSLL
jgi:hypothetical protein